MSFGRHNIVEEAVLYGRSEAELYAGIELLQCFGQQVSRCMPEGVLALFVIKLIKFDRRICVYRAVKLGCLTIYPARYNVASESR